MSASMILRASSTVSTGSVVPGTIGTPAFFISSRAFVLEPIASMALAGGPMKTMPASSPAGGRADEDDARLFTGAREGRVLGEEAVAGVDRLGAGLLDHLEDLLDLEVALGGRRAAEEIRLAGALDVERVAVELRVDRHRGDP